MQSGKLKVAKTIQNVQSKHHKLTVERKEYYQKKLLELENKVSTKCSKSKVNKAVKFINAIGPENIQGMITAVEDNQVCIRELRLNLSAVI